jgi:rare lipoprotein A
MRVNFLIFTISLILLIIISGCSLKPDTVGGPAGYLASIIKEKTKQRKSRKIPPTQRPYTIDGIKYYPLASAEGYVQTGIASWYGKKFHGRKTSNAETYNMYAMTAAHKTLPMNTWVLVHNLVNDKKIKLRINDRGPFVAGRIIDLSYTGAKKIGIVGPGTAKVRVTALGEALVFSKKDKIPTSFRPVNYQTGNFTLQVGAFQGKANAEKYRDKLAGIYPNVHIRSYTDQRGSFYRVRLGRFTNLKDAERFCAKLLNREEFSNVSVVAE